MPEGSSSSAGAEDVTLATAFAASATASVVAVTSATAFAASATFTLATRFTFAVVSDFFVFASMTGEVAALRVEGILLHCVAGEYAAAFWTSAAMMRRRNSAERLMTVLRFSSTLLKIISLTSLNLAGARDSGSRVCQPRR